MAVSLRQNTSPRLVEFLDPAGEQIDSERVDAARQVSFSLVDQGAEPACEGILEPGEYTLAVNTRSGEAHRESVMLEPDLSITDITTPPSLGSFDDFPESGKSRYYGSFVIEFANTGSLPACVTRTQILGDDVIIPRTGTEQDGEQGDRADLYGGSGAGLDWYATDAPLAHETQRVAVWVGKQRYITTYLPFVIPEERYEAQAFEDDDSKEKVRDEYGGKVLGAVLTAQTSTGQRIGLPFYVHLSGEIIPLSRMFGQNVYLFTNTQVAFNPKDTFDIDDTSKEVSSMADDPPPSGTFPENATGDSQNATASGDGGTATGTTSTGES